MDLHHSATALASGSGQLNIDLGVHQVRWLGSQTQLMVIDVAVTTLICVLSLTAIEAITYTLEASTTPPYR